jgi:hypothetical protein
VVAEKAERVRNFHHEMVIALAELAASAGLESPHEFAPHHFLERCGPGDVRTLDRVHHFVPSGCLLDGSAPEPLSEIWSRAEPSRFA